MTLGVRRNESWERVWSFPVIIIMIMATDKGSHSSVYLRYADTDNENFSRSRPLRPLLVV